MQREIYPCLWFDNQSSEAAEFYKSIFNDLNIISINPMVTYWEMQGQKYMGLNGGPMFKINPSISMFVVCDTKEEAEQYWKQLSEEGKVMLNLQTYPWSEYYGWCADKFGMTWQIFLGESNTLNQKISTSFLFANQNYGKADEAVKFYVNLFKDSELVDIQYYADGGPQPVGNVMFSEFRIGNRIFHAMDGPGNHEFDFNEALSFVIECENQDEIDYYWNTLLAAGGKESRCGWISDQFGVWWQVIPANLGALMSNPATREKTAEAFMKMSKFIIADL